MEKIYIDIKNGVFELEVSCNFGCTDGTEKEFTVEQIINDDNGKEIQVDSKFGILIARFAGKKIRQTCAMCEPELNSDDNAEEYQKSQAGRLDEVLLKSTERRFKCTGST